MDYTKLGNTGLDVSRICLGCMGFGDAERWTHKWVLDEENSRPIIKHALDMGINVFDTANIYSLMSMDARVADATGSLDFLTTIDRREEVLAEFPRFLRTVDTVVVGAATLRWLLDGGMAGRTVSGYIAHGTAMVSDVRRHVHEMRAYLALDARKVSTSRAAISDTRLLPACSSTITC